LKAVFSKLENSKTLQECREACGGQGLKTDNRIGQLKMEYDVQLTFEGDNNVLMQQVSQHEIWVGKHELHLKCRV
jgi:acyl-CoA oxidase